MSTVNFPTPDELAALLPQYGFQRLLAQGGMGAVYVAEQLSLGRPVAIKVLSLESSGDTSYRDRFVAEARLLGQLRHPNIVDVHDFGETAGMLYIVMELLEGTTLLRRIHDRKLKQPEVVRIAAQICDALSAAHARGVVHRDVKPENIFLNDGLHVKLGDFGIAQPRGTDQDSDPDGMRLGTPEYAAPEMFDFTKPVDHRADIFSLGVVLYEMLAGSRPDQRVFVPPSHKREGVSTRFDAIVRRAMQAAPENRYQSADAMKHDIVQVLKGTRLLHATQPLTPVQRSANGNNAAANRPSRTGRTLVLAAAGCGLAAVAAIYGAPLIKRLTAEDPPPTADPRPSAGGLFPSIAEAGDPPASNSAGNPAADPGPKADPPPDFPPDFPPDPGPSPDPDPPEPDPPDPAPSVFVRGDPDGDDVMEWNGRHYQFVGVQLSWEDAEARARERGGHLATIGSKEESDAIIEYVGRFMDHDHDTCWIGGTDIACEGRWEWVTGEPFAYSNWGGDAPSDGGLSGKSQQYLSLNRRDDYGGKILWNDHGYPTGGRLSMLIEWDEGQAASDAAGTPWKPPAPRLDPAPPGVAGAWQALRWTAGELASGGVAATEDDGTLTFSREGSIGRTAGFGFRNAAIAVRLVAGNSTPRLDLRLRRDDGERFGVAYGRDSGIRLFRRSDKRADRFENQERLANCPAPKGECLLELRIVGDTLTALLNGEAVVSAKVPADRPFCGVEIGGTDVVVRNAQWLPLPDAGADDVLAITPPPAAGSALAEAIAKFREAAETTFAAKLSASLTNLRDWYARRLRELAGGDEANAPALLAEAALAESGGNPAEKTRPEEPAVLADLRKTWHAEYARRHASSAPAAVPVYKAFAAKLESLVKAARDESRAADAAEAAAWLSAAKLRLTRFETPRAGTPAARW